MYFTDTRFLWNELMTLLYQNNRSCSIRLPNDRCWWCHYEVEWTSEWLLRKDISDRHEQSFQQKCSPPSRFSAASQSSYKAVFVYIMCRIVFLTSSWSNLLTSVSQNRFKSSSLIWNERNHYCGRKLPTLSNKTMLQMHLSVRTYMLKRSFVLHRLCWKQSLTVLFSQIEVCECSRSVVAAQNLWPRCGRCADCAVWSP